jgi:glycosyltransferase involved in cell wall biosynthesis
VTNAFSLRADWRDRDVRVASPAMEAPERRPVIYDMSHLIARLRADTATGIDRIDLAYATHFFSQTQRGAAARYGATSPRLIAGERAREFTRAAQGAWMETPSPQARALWAWLASPAGEPPLPALRSARGPKSPAWGRRLLSWTGYLSGSARRAVPEGAVYINVGYHRFEHPKFFSWLAERPDVDAVFMIHDLLPLDYPEYFEPGEAEKFRKRIATALRYGRAFLVSTQTVRRRLQKEIAARGLVPRPIWARPFPSPLAEFSTPSLAPRAAAYPYFVIVGTIEPRKNHMLLLQIWREMARRATPPPRLVIVGGRGWENEQVLDMLDRCVSIAPHVAETSNLGSRELAELMAGARAVLAPSFNEGYGLPIVEALALGAPVVASDTEAAREVTQGRARLLSPVDGAGWTQEIERLATDDAYHQSLKQRAAGFEAPNWRDYFASLDRFLAELGAAGRA